MEHKSQQLPPKEAAQHKDREPLSDQKLGEYLAAFGNHEGKSLLLASMKPDAAYTAGQLSKLVQPKGEKIFKGTSIPFGWCEYSLAPIGLVTKEIIDPDKGIVGYEITKEGNELGVSLAGHLLAFSEKHPELSLYQLSGATISSSKRKTVEEAHAEKKEPHNRAPLTRSRIFQELVTRDLPIRKVDLVQSLANDYPEEYEDSLISIGKHLRNLSEAGIITYESIKADEPVVFYSPADSRPEAPTSPYRTETTLTNQVDNILSNTEKAVSVENIHELLLKEFPEYEAMDQNAFKDRISKTLNHLDREGYAKKEDFQKNMYSTITLTDAQRETLLEFTELVEKFRSLNPEFLTEGRRKAQEIVSDQERFSSLMQKAYDASPNAQGTDTSETNARILTFLKENPGKTNNDIEVYLKERFGQNLGKNRIRALTKSLVNYRQLTAEQDKRQIRYSVPEEQQDEQKEETNGSRT